MSSKLDIDGIIN